MNEYNIKKDFTKEQSKEHWETMRLKDGLDFLYGFKVKQVEITDSQYKKMDTALDRMWRGLETGIKDDLKKNIIQRQSVVMGMIMNCRRVDGVKLRKAIELAVVQIVLLNRMETRWKRTSGKSRLTYDQRETLETLTI